jgi:hypothetical protein
VVSPITTPVPWSMKKDAPIARPRVDVDAGPLVGELGHHARHHDRALLQERMRDPVHRDRVGAGVA